MAKFGKFLKLIGNSAYRKALPFGVAAALEHEDFLRSEPCATMIDAGANKGQFTLATRALRPDTSVIAFEPLAGPSSTFRKLFANDPRVTLIPAALGSLAGETDIHVARRADSSSLLPIGKLQSELFPGTDEQSISKITVMRLDDALDVSKLPKPVVLKIDVQGFELEVLKGAQRSLATIQSIYVELSFVPLYLNQPLAHEVIAWLADRKFALAGVFHLARGVDGRVVQADMLFRGPTSKTEIFE